MKVFRNILNVIKPTFEKGGKLEKLYPAYDAFETFLFVPDHTTKSGSHIRDSIDLKRTMFMVVIALIPCLLFGMWNVGYQYNYATSGEMGVFEEFMYGFWRFIPLILVSYIVGLTVEFAFAVFRGHQVNEGYLVTGMLIPLTMPIDVPLWMLAISVIFAVVIGKEVFGGTGMNILNPALSARAFLFFAYPTYMSGDKVWVSEAMIDSHSGATILGDLASKKGWDQGSWSTFDMFAGFIPGSVGETSIIAIGIGAIILLLTGVGSWRIILSTFIGGYLMAYLFNLWGYNELMQTPAHIHLIIGSFAFGAVFMATDPVTASQTNLGKYIYGFLIGVFAILIRVFNPAYPEGMMLAILLMNVFAPLIDHYVIQSNINRRLKRVKSTN
ncbi:MAG: NADH:ubiquinone reductase (Na(+)-transporting) subunit B [Flavobacteriales bacterium]|nr:NADH:ubiquinone reductase (Na(+)-transporting) subunit B [Flavobacteriales bacterium]